MTSTPPPASRSGSAPERPALRADCANCFGLCCVALPFARSADFGFDKAAGEPCRNLAEDFRCGIHATLRPKGFAGCSTFDCFGAGQLVAKHTFAGTSWRDEPSSAAAMFEVFPVVRALHEILWYLECARTIAPGLSPELDATAEHIRLLADQSPDGLLAIDLDAERAIANPLLARASESVRAANHPGDDSSRDRFVPGADLIGATLAGADLRAVSLRGAYLIGADLGGSNLGFTDVIGADLRGANVCGADLSTAIYLTQFQVNSARGDASTRLPASLLRPGHWR